jgi:ABC-type polysaccharide/polyol phosphate export permease
MAATRLSVGSREANDVRMGRYLVDLYRQRRLIRQLAYGDFRARHSGALLGFFWAFVQPLLSILMYLFIYQVGFRAMPLGKVPFVLWLIVGIVPWFYFADGLISATNSLVEYSYLVKKVMFNVTLIPTIKLCSAALTHVLVLAVALVIVVASGFFPRLSWLQLPYYLFALVFLVSGLSFFTSAATAFVRDIGQAVTVGMQFGFWLTPIAWSLANAPARFVPFLKLNPLYYVVEGMRDSVLVGTWFWQKPYQTVYFWAVALALNVIGYWVFRRLRPHFADVL